MTWQDYVALFIAFLAAVFLVHKLTGWPRLGRKKKAAPVILGERLRRGLQKR